MLASSAALMADDVSIQCRVRRSPYATNPKFDEPIEITCTLRNWEISTTTPSRHRPTERFSMLGNIDENSNRHNEDGPELVLTPAISPISRTISRDESPIPQRSRRRQVRPLRHKSHSPFRSRPEDRTLHAVTIPLSDIMVVETYNVRYGAAARKLHITTLAKGYFEFDCLSRNGHDVLLTFLQASLAPERIIDGHLPEEGAPALQRESMNANSSVTSCLDVDALMDQHLRGSRASQETWPEKLSRRMGKVVNSLAEISASLCDASCCRNPNDDALRDSPPEKTVSTTATNSLRQDDEEDGGSNVRGKNIVEIYGMEESLGTHPQKLHHQHHKFNSRKYKEKLMLRQNHLPSGLSVEPDPEISKERYY